MIEEYSRKEIVGYMILALKGEGKNKEQIKNIISKMETCMTMWTEVYDEQTYDKFYGI